MLGLRLDEDMEARLASVARRQGRTKSEVAREAINAHLARIEGDVELVAEVRRIAALTSEADLGHLDDLQDDLERLMLDEEVGAAARKAA